jgi:hypothetical protein
VLVLDGINKLACNADAVARFLDAALQDILNPKFTRNVLSINRAPLVGKGGVTTELEDQPKLR